MPAFAPRISDTGLWDLIQYLRALSEAEEARSLTSLVEPWRPIVAPDFNFESPGQAQESLSGQRGRHVTLLVLYTLPESLPRLHELSAKEKAFAHAGVRVIAVPASTSATVDKQTMKDEQSMFPIASSEVDTAYAMFARQSSDFHNVAPTHVEFLIDRQGYFRARWMGIPDSTTDQSTEILDEVKLLKLEPARPAAPEGHAHG